MKTQIFDYVISMINDNEKIIISHSKGQKLVLLLCQSEDKIPPFVFLNEDEGLVNVKRIHRIKPVPRVQKDWEINPKGVGRTIPIERELTPDEERIQIAFDMLKGKKVSTLLK